MIARVRTELRPMLRLAAPLAMAELGWMAMGFVDVVADGPSGVIDRFTILGERYSDDLAAMLRQLCPGRSNGQDQNTIGVVVAGS